MTDIMLIQILRNQLTDMSSVLSYAITQKDKARHSEYELRINETKALLRAVDKS